MRQTQKKKIFAAFIILIFIAASLPLIHNTLMHGAEKSENNVQLYIGKTKVTKKTYLIEVGTSKKLRVKSSSDLGSVQYRSSDKKIVTVNKTGTIRAKSAGTAKITVTVNTDLGSKTIWTKIKVTPKKSAVSTITPTPTFLPTPVPSEMPNPSDKNKENILIVYFSRTGNTEFIADEIARQTGGTKILLETSEPYPENYNEILEIASQEKQQNARPKLKTVIEHMEAYDIVFIGYPIWHGDTPMAIQTFLESYNFAGKKIIPFCTSGSSSPQASFTRIKETASSAEVLNGFWVRGANANNAADDITKWLDELNLSDQKQNNPTILPEPSKEESELMKNKNKLKITVGSTSFTATLEENSSAEALKELLADKPLTLSMSDYASMEKVGELGTTLPRNDERITTKPGDLILYLGNSFVIYYDTNTWNFTRLGKIDDITKAQLLDVLGDGDVTVTLSLED